MKADEADLIANITANLIFGQWNCSFVRKDDFKLLVFFQ